METLKFTVKFKFPCNFHSASRQSAEHKAATIETDPSIFGTMKICIVLTPFMPTRIFKNSEQHYTGVMTQRLKGGKWEEIMDSRYQTKEDWLLNIKQCNTFETSNFRGHPRISKEK